jgi:MFS-type transporter involved in bile tolerance (Atg22 family)
MNEFLALLLIVALIAIVICFPLLAIWALNALVPFAIAVNFKTWLAALVLILVFGGSGAVSRSK